MLSGGLDSAVALFWTMKKKHWKVEGLSFDYYGRSKREMKSARDLAAHVSCPLRIIDVSFLKEVEDLKTRLLNFGLRKAPTSYIPSRNVVFYGIASSIAEVTDATYIVAGHNADDIDSFPDSSLQFFKSFNRTTEIGLFTGAKTGRVVVPLGKLSKKDVIILGDDLGVPFDLTWSCYESGSKPCGVCLACKLRASGFREAGIHDPLSVN